MQKMPVRSLGREDHQEREQAARSSVLGLPCGSDGKESACNAGDLGLVPGLERSPGEGNGYPLQYSCLQDSMDKGTWQTTVRGVAKSLIHLSDFHLMTVWGFPCGASGKEPTCQCRRHERPEFAPWVRKTPWRREGQPTTVFLPEIP